MFQENLQLLRSFNPQLAILLAAYVCSQKNDTEVSLKDENQFMEPQEWLQKLLLENIEVLFVYGIGDGSAYIPLESWLTESSQRYLVFFEDDLDTLHAFLHTQQASQILLNTQIHIHYTGDSEHEERSISTLVQFFTLTPFTCIALQRHQIHRSQRIKELFGKLSRLVKKHDYNSLEYLKGGDTFFSNFYPNLMLLPQAYQGVKFFKRFRNVPAIICGAGPSLNKNISLLRTLGEKALLFAGGSSANALTNQGVRPHFVAHIDPNPDQLKRVETNSAFEVPNFYRNRVYHPVLKFLHSPPLFINGCGGHQAPHWFEEQLNLDGSTYLDEGNNVVNWCVELACHLGCSPIIFVGMDLAYTDQKSYAGGVVRDPALALKDITEGNAFDGQAFLHPDIFGNKVWTLWKWIEESEWVGKCAEKFSEHPFINATEGGIGFPGVRNLPLNDVAERYCQAQWNLYDRVHSVQQEAGRLSVTQMQIQDILMRWNNSIETCRYALHKMLMELLRLMQALQKGEEVSFPVSTPEYVLAELDLEEEIAFQECFKIISFVYEKMLERGYCELDRDPKMLLSDKLKKQRLLQLQATKVKYLLDCVVQHDLMVKNSLLIR